MSSDVYLIESIRRVVDQYYHVLTMLGATDPFWRSMFTGMLILLILPLPFSMRRISKKSPYYLLFLLFPILQWIGYSLIAPAHFGWYLLPGSYLF